MTRAAGTCFSVSTIGYLDLRLSHPTLTCGRLNVSENNRALPSDRFYVSYRHFANSTPGRLFQFAEDFDLDRFTLAGEKTCADGRVSFELRVPLAYRLNSDPYSRAYDIVPGNGDDIFDFGEGDGTIDPETFHLFGHRETELGNMSAILKSLLYRDDSFAFSGGLGVTVPTAEDVHYSLDFQNILITYADLPGLEILAARYRMDLAVSNETVYLAPFAAWLWQPRKRFFHHGFLQVEVAANSSPVHMRDFGSIGVAADEDNVAIVQWAINPPDGATVNLNAQTLMRLNLGVGYICYENPAARYLQQIAGMLEVHYTTPLDDARLSRFPLDLTLTDLEGNVTAVDAYDPVLGNLANRVDIVNLATGVSTTIGRTVITNGFVVPLRTGENRGFDFEYNCQVQRTF